LIVMAIPPSSRSTSAKIGQPGLKGLEPAAQIF
jgi:hypothetical protein